ncbi:MAG: prolipoprotein diacylglyceryl transferase [Opitutaceae bacterium]|jgi:phosphatidylglycerol---prolipoprotein diacylglyceryl transferase|nr:prolipoprotein diacylglyceryl transferase [Opitutaceae bacterium]
MDQPPSHWVHDLSPFLIRFTEQLGVRYYGLAYLLGFALGGWILYRASIRGRLALPPASVADLMTALIIGVMAGGRLGYFVLYEPGTLFSNPFQLFKILDGGMSSHGGFVGVGVAIWWFVRKQNIRFLALADATIAVAPLGIGLGRVANFINGELWGRVSNVSWAVIFPTSARPGTPVSLIDPRHPSQLYAAMLEGFLIFGYLQWRYWRTNAPGNQPGRITGEFLIIYAIARMITEIFREPDAGLILGLTRGTFYSIFMIVAGLIVIRRSKSLGQPTRID